MSRISSIVLQPSKVRQQIDARLRANGYGGLNATVEWLRQRGVDVSRSALGRYAISLRTADAMTGKTGARLHPARLPRGFGGRPVAEIVREHEELHAKQATLFRAIVRQLG